MELKKELAELVFDKAALKKKIEEQSDEVKETLKKL